MASKLEREAMQAVLSQMEPQAVLRLSAAARQLKALHPLMRYAAEIMAPLRRL